MRSISAERALFFSEQEHLSDQALAEPASLPLQKSGVFKPGKMTARTRGPQTG
jgi:hypothetical protein